MSPLTHILSVDVEDYFMVEAFAGSVSRSSWNSWPSRVVANTRRALELFDKYNVKGTFFFVGWVAKNYPELVREVHALGHELACHGFWHRTVYSLTPDEFREDTRAALWAIENAAGVKVLGYRAPSWSITKDCLWALDILADEGFTYDSSVFPIHHDLYGLPGASRFPYTHISSNGRLLREFPPATMQIFGQNLPGAGGGYLRVFPLSYTHWLFRKFEETYRERVVVYLHPWELDPEQPRIGAKLKSRLRHYTNLHRMEERLETLLQRYNFQPFRKLLISETGEGTAPLLSRAEGAPGFSAPWHEKNDAVFRVGVAKTVASPAESESGAASPARSLPRRGMGGLTYHSITRYRSDQTYALSRLNFEQHLKVVVGLSRSGMKSQHPPLVTFDDGHISHFEYALPLLEQYSVLAIFFVVGSFIESKPDFMTWRQLRELAALGHEVQSHSWSHALLTHCSDDELQEELERSRDAIEQHLGKGVDALGIPGGRWDKRVLRAAANAGYRRVYTSDPRIISRGEEGVQLFGRLTIKNSMNATRLENLVRGQGFYPILFRGQYFAKELFRQLVGDGTYKRMWSSLSSRKQGGNNDFDEDSSQKGREAK